MLVRRVRIGCALLVGSAVLIWAGFASPAFGGSPNESPCVEKPVEAKAKKKCGLCDVLFSCFKKKEKACPEPAQTAYKNSCPDDAMTTLPPNPAPGECYAKMVVPAEYRTVSERHMVQEASERIEVVPATYKWVEERVMVKQASTQLEVIPAEYRWEEKRIEVQPAHTGWVTQSAADCAPSDASKIVPGEGVLCLKTTPAEYKTIRTQCLVRPASVRTIQIPAEYQTVRKQVVDTPATTRRVAIPAQYVNVEKKVLVCPERVKWGRVACEEALTAKTPDKGKSSPALAAGANLAR